MATYKRKNPTIEAFKLEFWKPEFGELGPRVKPPPTGDIAWFWKRVTTSKIEIVRGQDHSYLLLHNPHGRMIVNEGDWVCLDVEGEAYACEAEIFDKIWEPVE